MRTQYLRTLYGKTTSATSSRRSFPRWRGWVELPTTSSCSESSKSRGRLARGAGALQAPVSALSIDELGVLEALSERISGARWSIKLASREEPAAVDKLIEIIKSGTDPQVRRRPSRRSPAGRTTPRHEAAARAGGKAMSPRMRYLGFTLTLAGIPPPRPRWARRPRSAQEWKAVGMRGCSSATPRGPTSAG